MAQIEVRVRERSTTPRWRWADVARRNPESRRRRVGGAGLHEGRGLLLPMAGWSGAGHDGHLRATPVAFR